MEIRLKTAVLRAKIPEKSMGIHLQAVFLTFSQIFTEIALADKIISSLKIVNCHFMTIWFVEIAQKSDLKKLDIS